MNLRQFEERAREMWEEVPPQFLEGIDGLVVSPDASVHPDQPDVHTMGECITEAYPSDWQGPETLRSLLVLYHGSFRRIAAGNPDFDWDGELWETLTHELRHHLESLAAEDALEGVDHVMDHEHRRYAGEPFDPLYYREGERRGDSLYQAETSWYLEREMPAATVASTEAARAPAAATLSFEWQGTSFESPVPETDADIVFLDVFFPSQASEDVLTIVLIRKKSWGRTLGAAFSGRLPAVEEFEVEVRPI